MIIARNQPTTGICFAWLPTLTLDGLVWLEYVRFHWNNNELGGWFYERLTDERDV